MPHADFTDANLSNASIENAQLTGVKLTNAILKNAYTGVGLELVKDLEGAGEPTVSGAEKCMDIYSRGGVICCNVMGSLTRFTQGGHSYSRFHSAHGGSHTPPGFPAVVLQGSVFSCGHNVLTPFG